MYVRKEALLSSQIEGTQATLEDSFEYENEIPLKNANDVEEVVNYIKALNYGMKRLDEFPMRGSASDDKGTKAEVEVHVNRDGSGQVDVSVTHDEDSDN